MRDPHSSAACQKPNDRHAVPVVLIAQLHDGVHRHRCAPHLLLDSCGSIFKDKKREDQVKFLWTRIKAWFRVRVDAKPPKLQAKGGETRYLIPFAAELAQQLH